MNENVEKTTGNTNSSEPKNGSNVVIIIVVIVLVLGILAIGGWYMFTKFVVNKVKDVVVTETKPNQYDFKAGDTEVSVAEEGQTVAWPNDLPPSIPKFTYGKINGSAKIDKTWTITITDVSESDFLNYKNMLTSNNWTIDNTLDFAEIKGYTAKNNQGVTININYTPNDSSLLFSVSLE